MGLTHSHKLVNRGVRGELRRIGREMLSDLKGNTPVITGRLRRSSYFELENEHEIIQGGSLGYTQEYAPEVEIKRGMLATTLNEWNADIHNRVSAASHRALQRYKNP